MGVVVLWFCGYSVSFAVSIIWGVGVVLGLCGLWLFIAGFGWCLW